MPSGQSEFFGSRRKTPAGRHLSAVPRAGRWRPDEPVWFKPGSGGAGPGSIGGHSLRCLHSSLGKLRGPRENDSHVLDSSSPAPSARASHLPAAIPRYVVLASCAGRSAAEAVQVLERPVQTISFCTIFMRSNAIHSSLIGRIREGASSLAAFPVAENLRCCAVTTSYSGSIA